MSLRDFDKDKIDASTAADEVIVDEAKVNAKALAEKVLALVDAKDTTETAARIKGRYFDEAIEDTTEKLDQYRDVLRMSKKGKKKGDTPKNDDKKSPSKKGGSKKKGKSRKDYTPNKGKSAFNPLNWDKAAQVAALVAGLITLWVVLTHKAPHADNRSIQWLVTVLWDAGWVVAVAFTVGLLVNWLFSTPTPKRKQGK